jgi:hypothetical protein
MDIKTRISILMKLSWPALRHLANKYGIDCTADKNHTAKLIATYEAYYVN